MLMAVLQILLGVPLADIGHMSVDFMLMAVLQMFFSHLFRLYAYEERSSWVAKKNIILKLYNEPDRKSHRMDNLCDVIFIGIANFVQLFLLCW